MKVTVIPIGMGAFGTILKELINRLEDLEIRRQVKNIPNPAILRSAKIQIKVLET